MNSNEEWKDVKNMYDLDMNYLLSFSSVNEAAEYVGHTHSHISNCLNGREYKAYGYIWRYKDEI